MPKEYTLIGGNGTRVSPLEVTESGTYEAGDSRAFNPVKVNLPSGSSALSGLTDVDISNPTDGQTLVYNATIGKWENGVGGGGGVLVCNVDFTTGALDKTYREVVNADVAVLKTSEEGITIAMYLSYFDDLPAAANSGAKAGGWTGHLAFVNISGTIEGSSLPELDFLASDPDGYPVLDQ